MSRSATLYACLLACSGCASGASRALEALPAQCTFAASIDLAAARGTPSWDRIEELFDALARSSEAAGRALLRLAGEADFHPLEDLATVTLGAADLGDKDLAFVAIASGNLDAARVTEALEEELGGRSLSVAILDEKTVALGTPDWVDAVVALRGGKGADASANATLAAAAKRVTPGAVAWLALEIAPEIVSALAAARVSVDGLGDAAEMAASIRLGKAPSAVLRLGDGRGGALETRLLSRAELERILSAWTSPGAGTAGPDTTGDGAIGTAAPETDTLKSPAVDAAVACGAYARCVRALAAAYDTAAFPGAADAAEALRGSLERIEARTGAEAGEACLFDLEAQRKSAGAYKSIPGFRWPPECL